MVVERAIVLMAFGKPEYAQMAFNLALSIRHESPGIPITLVAELKCLRGIVKGDEWVFDHIVEVDHDDLYLDGKFNPGRAKTRIYKYLPAESNMYLDVDALVCRNLSELFDLCESTGNFYHTQVVGSHSLASGGRDFKEMQWAWADDLCEHYEISPETTLWATNSSFAWIKKCDASELFFEQIQKNIDNGLPLSKLRLRWGNTFPDELALNAALSQFNIDATIPEVQYPIFFSYHNVPLFNIEKVKEAGHFILGYYGGRNFTSISMWRYYDDYMFRLCRKVFRREHYYKGARLVKSKHANHTQQIA